MTLVPGYKNPIDRFPVTLTPARLAYLVEATSLVITVVLHHTLRNVQRDKDERIVISTVQ